MRARNWGRAARRKLRQNFMPFAVPSKLLKVEVMVTIGADTLRNCTGTSIRSSGRSVATGLFWLFLRDHLDNLNSVVVFGSQEARRHSVDAAPARVNTNNGHRRRTSGSRFVEGIGHKLGRISGCRRSRIKTQGRKAAKSPR